MTSNKTCREADESSPDLRTLFIRCFLTTDFTDRTFLDIPTSKSRVYLRCLRSSEDSNQIRNHVEHLAAMLFLG
jgi:hypothetical protein